MQKILLQNNIIHALNENGKEAKYFYAPLFQSNFQKEFHKKRYEQIKSQGYDVQWCTNISEKDYDKAYAWNSSYEVIAFKEKLSSSQNRLLDLISFECPDGFSQFKNIAFKVLPSHFPDAHSPIDYEVIEKIESYFENPEIVHTYFETRNQLIGTSFSTKLSNYLSTGHLDVKYLYNKIFDFENKHGSTKSSQWIIFELLWREFFYWHYQKHRERYFSYNGIKGPKEFSNFEIYDFDHLKKLNAHPFFYAALKELEFCGFLSNRARQMFASIWINDLKLDWRSGANLFERYLIDYDVYSNYGNWMYLAGVGVDPRGKRYFNIPKQLEIYDPENNYLNFWHQD